LDFLKFVGDSSLQAPDYFVFKRVYPEL